jgi:hypothetical protein
MRQKICWISSGRWTLSTFVNNIEVFIYTQQFGESEVIHHFIVLWLPQAVLDPLWLRRAASLSAGYTIR